MCLKKCIGFLFCNLVTEIIPKDQMPEFPNIILFSIPFFVLAMLLELYVTTKQNIKTYKAKDAFASISMGIGNVLIGFFSKIVVFAALYFVYDQLGGFLLFR